MNRARSIQDLVRAVRAAGVSDERILKIIDSIPRTDFVPVAHRGLAHHDQPIPIAHGQVTTQPSLSATMIEALDLAGKEHVLEVGTGLGFQTALMACLAADVVTIERWPDMVRAAEQNLVRQEIRNVELFVGDGSCGVPSRAPFDAIVVSAAFPEVPPPLIEQLRIGGRLVQPIGPGGREQVVLFQRCPDGLQRHRVLTRASFVRLHGRYGHPL
jgi:protein-L-isoaspartate(D-aspartate) O-methyltransferase